MRCDGMDCAQKQMADDLMKALTTELTISEFEPPESVSIHVNFFVCFSGHISLWYYLSCPSSLSIIQSHKHYNANNIHQRYNINICGINK